MARVPTDLTSFLREARAKSKLTQKAVAEGLNVSVQLVSQWETGERKPPLKKLQEVAETYKVSESDLQKYLQGHSASKEELEDGFGVRRISQVLSDTAEAATGAGATRSIVHSFSTRGFLTGKNLELAKRVLHCAQAGVDLVFVCLSGSSNIPSTISHDLTPEGTYIALQAHFGLAQQSMRLQSHELDLEKVKEHLWFVLPKSSEMSEVAVDVFGSVVRLLAVIHETRGEAQKLPMVAQEEKTKLGRRGTVNRHRDARPKAANNGDWSRIVPEFFTLQDVWLNVDQEDEHSGEIRARWDRVHTAAEVETRYHAALQKLKQSEKYAIRHVLD